MKNWNRYICSYCKGEGKVSYHEIDGGVDVSNCPACKELGMPSLIEIRRNPEGGLDVLKEFNK